VKIKRSGIMLFGPPCTRISEVDEVKHAVKSQHDRQSLCRAVELSLGVLWVHRVGQK